MKLHVYLSEDVNMAVSYLTLELNKIFNLMALFKTIQITSRYNPWISEETKQMMKERDRLHEEACRTGNWSEFKRLRNKVNNRLKYEENYYKKKKFQECRGDPKSSWKTLKSVLNWQSSESPSKLFYKGELKTKDKDIADSQNEYFIEKVKNLRNELPQQTDDPTIFL